MRFAQNNRVVPLLSREKKKRKEKLFQTGGNWRENKTTNCDNTPGGFCNNRRRALCTDSGLELNVKYCVTKQTTAILARVTLYTEP